MKTGGGEGRRKLFLVFGVVGLLPFRLPSSSPPVLVGV
jgi:hypothetical protein